LHDALPIYRVPAGENRGFDGRGRYGRGWNGEQRRGPGAGDDNRRHRQGASDGDRNRSRGDPHAMNNDGPEREVTTASRTVSLAEDRKSTRLLLVLLIWPLALQGH